MSEVVLWGAGLLNEKAKISPSMTGTMGVDGAVRSGVTCPDDIELDDSTELLDILKGKHGWELNW